jgi:chorismate mutase
MSGAHSGRASASESPGDGVRGRSPRAEVSGAHSGRASADDRLESLRASIDNIDAALVHILAERFKVTQTVGRYKAQTGLPAADPDREARQIARLRDLASESGLDPAFTEAFIRFIVSEVIRHHETIAAEIEAHD